MKKKVVALMCCMVLTLCACGHTTDTMTSEENTSREESVEEITVEVTEETEETEPEETETEDVEEVPTIDFSALEHRDDTSETKVYFTTEISSDALMAAYNALGWAPTGNVAIKLSTGEPPASYYLDPELIKELVQSVDGTIVECNTAYGGMRTSTAYHLQVAEDHGFTAIADVDILDAEGSMAIPVEGGTHLQENVVGTHFVNYDSYIVLSHFKGHAMAGYGGAIKNISIGLASQPGKCLIHTAGVNARSPWGGEQDGFLASMGDAGKSVSDYLGKGENIVYINVLNNISIDCDCNGYPSKPDIHDIGILASTDPVALDQACIDMIYLADGNASLVARIEGQNGLYTLEHAESIGLGNRTYQLVDLDEQ